MMTNFKSLTRESLQADMDGWAAKVDSSPSWASAHQAAKECARVKAAAFRAGFNIVNPHEFNNGVPPND